MKVSPGFISAMNTAWLAWLPECGCTLAKPAAEQLLGALDGERSRRRRRTRSRRSSAGPDSPRRIVGQHRALRLQHGAGDDVLGGDQLDLVALAAELQRRWRGRSPDRLSARLAEKKLFDRWACGFCSRSWVNLAHAGLRAASGGRSGRTEARRPESDRRAFTMRARHAKRGAGRLGSQRGAAPSASSGTTTARRRSGPSAASRAVRVSSGGTSPGPARSAPGSPPGSRCRGRPCCRCRRGTARGRRASPRR